jgi:catechol 2,3-dioxygenase-like lactoylglutathione lyase family enzyme
MPKPDRIAHILFMTRRFDEMVDWYQTVFESEVVQQNPALAFLTFDNENHRFGIANLDELKGESTAPEHGEVGINHVAFTYDSIGGLLDTYARLKEAGVHPYWTIHHGMTVSFYFQDPDGNRMELQVDSLDQQASLEYMAGEAFAGNPIGVAFDADELLAAYRAGAPGESLLAMPDGPMSPIPPEHGIA